jgi:hypothetical protein
MIKMANVYVNSLHYDDKITKIYHMDIEIFPNWWSIVFINDGKVDVFTSDDDNLDEIEEITKHNIITAYYGKGYDFKILYALLKGISPQQLYELSMTLIKYKGETDNSLIRRFVKSAYWSKFKFIDLIDDLSGSLKEHESNMGIAVIESNVPFGKENLTEEDKEDIIKYNIHDVRAQIMIFTRRLKGYYTPKIILAELFELNPIECLKQTNPNLSAMILSAKKLPKHKLRDRPYSIPENIKNYVTKFVPEEILTKYLTIGMDAISKKKYKKDLLIDDFNNKGNFGKGGIHTTNKKGVLRLTNKKYKIFLIDVGRYYPSMMLIFEFLSRAVENPELFQYIVDQKDINKLEGNKLLEKAFKLIINSCFGGSGLKFNKLYDPNNTWSITITGQLLLYALSKDLWLNANCKIIQDNTDGIMVAIKDADIPTMKKLVNTWEKMTGFNMDYDPIKIIAQRDVNNYACMYTNGKTKVKGELCMQAISADESAFEEIVYQNWNMRIVHEAVFRFLIYKEPIEDTIRNCTDLMMFISTTKTGYTFDKTLYYVDGKPREVQKVNRVLAVKSSRLGTIKKFKYKDSRTGKPQYNKMPKISEHVSILNKDMSYYDWGTWGKRIDYEFYIKAAKEKVKGWMK